ncbi:hypothetical protein [Pseudomonas peradeniyensis]|uniref:Uncharacterized protein n=1 Tax=Pseudomonas peradeniyensis TaxID=2745488 RepID=A0ABT2VFH1_9PSED|nr:hypothetical protein [Pseudomonas peradeniyensis]MCU7240383.1 hypothetical protein [Pseudomonas peradeniyensis]
MSVEYRNPDDIRDLFEKATSLYSRPTAPQSLPTDNDKAGSHTVAMNDITREELRSTLSEIENRMDRRFERLEQAEERRAEAWRREQDAYRHEQSMRDRLYSERFEATSRRLEDRDKVIDAKLDAITSSVKIMSDKVDGFSGQLTSKVEEVRSSNKHTVWAILGIAVSVGIATVIGLWGANSTIVGSASSIFAAGQQQTNQQKALEELLEETKSQAAETRNLLERLKNQSTIAPPPRKP